MHALKTLALAAVFALTSGMALAQSVGNGGNPGAANTTDPNSAPHVRNTHRTPSTTGDASGRMHTRSGVDAAGRANTSDPNSAMSGGTDSSGHPVNPVADPRRR